MNFVSTWLKGLASARNTKTKSSERVITTVRAEDPRSESMQMKTSTQVRKNGSAPRPPKQASTQLESAAVPHRTAKPESTENWSLLLQGERDQPEWTGLWATPDGRLFLWKEGDAPERRAVDAPEALAWCKKNFGDVEPNWLPPLFPDDSPADKLIYAACQPTTRINAAKENAHSPVVGGEPARCPVSFLDMETPVQEATALLKLYAWELYRRKEGSEVSPIGIIVLADKCAKGLNEAWKTTCGLVFKCGPVPVVSDKLVDCHLAIVRLESAIRYMDVLLGIISEELAWDAKENQDNEASAPAFWEMAGDCVQMLKSQWDAASKKWSAFIAPVLPTIDELEQRQAA